MMPIAAPAPAVHSVDLSGFRAGRSTGLWACLIQLPERSRADIPEDRSNVQGLNILEQLMDETHGHASMLAKDAQPDQTSLLLFPEYAFGSGDWSRIDSLVRGFSRDVILIATFGASPIACVDEIEAAAAASGTAIHRGWRTQLTGSRRINFGCVWVKNNAEQACALFGKRYAEQSVEATNLRILEFTESTAIELNDLRIMPSICADFIKNAGQDGTRSIIAEIAEYAQRDEKPALITASLLQAEGQSTNTWVASIETLAVLLGNKNAICLLCNVATKSPDNKNSSDKWRNLTGIYLSKQFPFHGFKSYLESAHFVGTSVNGWTARSWYPQIILGELRLPPYNSVNHAHPWICNGRFGIDGAISSYTRDAVHEDLLLYCHASGLGAAGNYTILTKVLDHLGTGAAPCSAKLATEFVNGPFFKKEPSTAPLAHENVGNIKLCLQGANALLKSAGVCTPAANVLWQSQSMRRGQLTINERSVALWRSSTLRQDELFAQLREDLDAAALRESLTIFGKGKDREFIQEEWKALCYDVTEGHDDDDEQYSDLKVDRAPKFADYVKVQDFGVIERLINGEHGANAQEHQRAFDGVVRICKGP